MNIINPLTNEAQAYVNAYRMLRSRIRMLNASMDRTTLQPALMSPEEAREKSEALSRFAIDQVETYAGYFAIFVQMMHDEIDEMLKGDPCDECAFSDVRGTTYCEGCIDCHE